MHVKWLVWGTTAVILAGAFVYDRYQMSSAIAALQEQVERKEKDQRRFAQTTRAAALERTAQLTQRLGLLRERSQERHTDSDSRQNEDFDEERFEKESRFDEEQDRPVGALTEAQRVQPDSSPVDDFAPIRESLESAFAEESQDSSWARPAEQLAHNALLDAAPDGSRIENVVCRTRMCRIESRHESREAAFEMVNAALLEADVRPWNGAFSTGLVSEMEPGGPVAMVTYLTREGYDLPAGRPSDE